jgi:hypothetical protein
MFLHPWALAIGAVAMGLPLAIHWLTKPRPARLPLSTLRFVREAVRQRRARHWLRDALVLLLRMAAIALIALALARPRFGAQPLVSQADQGETVRVVVLDVSQSMAAMQHGVEGLERGRTIAADHLRYSPQLRTNLILAAAQSRAIFTEPSLNSEALRDELARAEVAPERLDVNRALGLAAQMLAPTSENDTRRRELVIVSDFQRTNWTRADFSPLPKETQIQLESIAPAETLPNVAILGARTRGRSASDAQAVLEVDVGNYSATAQRLHVEVTLGEATLQLEGAVPAGQRTTLAGDMRLPAAGWQTGAVTLVNVDDALAADDTRPLALEVVSQPTYVLLTRQTAAQRPSSSHYLECALVPGGTAEGSATSRVLRLHPEAANRDSLAAASLVIVDHPGKLSRETISLLAGLLRRGRPIWYVASEGVDATNLKLLAEAAGTSLQMPVEFMPGGSGQPRRNLFLTSYRTEETPLAVFGDGIATFFGRLRFTGVLSSRSIEGTLQEDVLATFNDGTACLVVTSTDGGALAVLNADLERSNLPTTGEAFVPLVQELSQHLLERGAPTMDAYCGEPLVARLPGAGAPLNELTIMGPKSSVAQETLGELRDEGIGIVWNWPAPVQRGVYQIQHQGDTIFALAVNLPAEESNLESLSADVLKNRLAAGRNVYFRSSADAAHERDDWWAWILAGCVVCILGEFAVLLALRS